MIHTLLSFLAALTVLIAVHEFGHYWVARRAGVKVIRFSIGFGRPLWRRQQRPEDTEFVISAIPLGGYVRMADEREAPVPPADLPRAFNRQSLRTRAAIVAAGPAANFVLAILLYWLVFMIGEPGIRPLLGDITAGTLAAEAGFRAGDEIVAVGDVPTPTWSEAMSQIIEQAMDVERLAVVVNTTAGETRQLDLLLPSELSQSPDKLYERLGLVPWQPELEPIVEHVEHDSRAEQAGLLPGDRIVSADEIAVGTWQAWVKIVRTHPETPIRLIVRRGDKELPVLIRPAGVTAPDGTTSGRIGAAARIPPEIERQMQVTYRLGFLPALTAAISKTAAYSGLTLRMIGRMLIGKAALENLSGPLSIAQYAGASARLGVAQFLKFLAAISVSLGVLNLLPIPVLDGGHLTLYGIEWIRGAPLSEQTVLVCQQIGLFILISLMSLAFYLDLERLLS